MAVNGIASDHVGDRLTIPRQGSVGLNARILIAAADPEVAAMKALLHDLGYAVCAAARSGRQAIAAVEEMSDGAHRPDLALIDTALEEEGVAAAGPLRRRFGVPSIFLSEAALSADLARIARLAEPAGYVSKPVVPWHLQVTIDIALAQHRRETELAEHARRLENEFGQRDQLKAAFGNQTELLNTVMNSISEGLIVVDRNGRYLISNPAMERIIGMYKPDSDLSQRSEVYGIYYPDRTTLIPSDQLPLARALHGESVDLFDVFVRNEKRPEGVLLSTSARPLYDVHGELRGGVVVFRDITRLMETQWQLRETARRMEEQSHAMQTVVDSMSEGVVAADADGNFTLFNPSARRIVGIGKTDTPPEQWSDRYGIFFLDETTQVPPDELPLTRAIRGQSLDEVELFVRNENLPKGAIINVSGRPLRDSEGALSGGVIVFRDVTEHIRTHQSLLQAFTQGRLEVLDTIVHNIGNAINSVAIGVGTLHGALHKNRELRRLRALARVVEQHQDDLPTYLQTSPQGRQAVPFLIALVADFSAQNRRLTETIDRVSMRVAHIVDLIRTQRAFDSESMTRKLVDLPQAVANAVKMLAESCRARGIAVRIDCGRAPRELWIQESRFNQMLVNLVKNAIEAIDALAKAGGAEIENGRINIDSYLQNDFLVIDVTDNGIGIDESHRTRIFSAGYSTKKNSSGLGLHSAANFVIGAGGSIQALSSGTGMGTTIRVKLRKQPIAPHPPAPRAAEAANT